MSENICYADAYARQTVATVVEVNANVNAVLLDRTVFYPGGGGQPADTGVLVADSGGDWRVIAAKKRGEDIWHTIEAGVALPAVGTQLTAELDWERRHQLMRTHSALHVLCGVVWRDHGALVTGGNMEPLSGRMDFEFETMSGDLVSEIERRVNEEIAADREIRVAVLPREEAFAIPDLIRTKVNLLPEGISEVRTIDIVGLDLQADGGTHVARTSEIGLVKVTGYESKGRINKRIRIQVTDAEMADTLALKALEGSELEFRVVRTRPAYSAVESASLQGIELGALLRTIVVRRGDDDYLFVLVPGGRRFDWAKLRAHLGVSRLSLPDAEEARAATGYERGAITPFGATRAWPVIVDEAAVQQEGVAIGGGARGVNLHLGPTALIEHLGAVVVDVSLDEAGA